MTPHFIAACALAGLVTVFASPATAQGDAVPLIASADPEAGAKLFVRCRACHTIEKSGRHRLGPNLWEVVGRPKASASGFRYSAALKKLGRVWDYAALDGYLEDPKAFAPGNRMAFPGLKSPAQRATVIAYLRTLSDSPQPLPEARAATTPPSAAAAPPEPQDFGDLPPGPGQEETYAICGACHSMRLVTQQGLSAERWDGLIDWMVEKQGMAPLEADERQRIVAYLAEHFGPDSRGRVDPMRPAMPMMAPPPMAPAMPPSP